MLFHHMVDHWVIPNCMTKTDHQVAVIHMKLHVGHYLSFAILSHPLTLAVGILLYLSELRDVM